MSEYALTPNLGLYKPQVDADDDMWGDHLNQNADILDAALTDISGSAVLAPGGSISRSLTERTTDNGYSVLECGAKGDWDWVTMTGTDDRAVIQALLDNPPVGKRITFPPGRQFYVGTGLVLATSSNLFLSGSDFSGIAYPPTTSGLVCDANRDCLLINSAQGCVVENLTFSSRATVQPTYGAGIKVLAGRRIMLHRTLCYNTFESYRWEGTDAGGLGGYMNEPYAAKVVRAFIVNNTWAELYVFGGGRIGNGPDWTTPQAHVSIEGGSTVIPSSTNGISITNITMQCQTGPVAFMQFVNRVPGALASEIFAIDINGMAMERGNPGMQYLFYSDGSWPLIDRFSMTNCYINAGTAEFWGFPSTTRILAVAISNNQLLNTATFTLAPAGAFSLQMASQQLVANVSVTSPSGSSTLSMTGMEIVGNVTLAGPWRGLSIIGGSISGTLTNNAVSNSTVMVPGQTTKITQDINIGDTSASTPVALRLNAAAGIVRSIRLQSAGVDRSVIGLTAGNNLSIQAMDVAGGLLGNALSVNNATGLVSFNLGAAILRAPPASATAVGAVGEIATDAGFIYVCTATNTWKRVAVATW